MKRRLILILLILFSSSAVANNRYHIKVAILDNPNLMGTKSPYSDNLLKAYLQGFKTAIEAAKAKNYDIQYKTFFYGNNLLDISNKVSDVKAWRPDVIIGLHSSNQFLITQNYFNDTMVISLFATDMNIKNMPVNFYSLGISDQYATDPVCKFLSHYFKFKDIFMIIEADSKESADLSLLLKENIQKVSPETQIQESKFLRDELETLDPNDLMKDAKKDSLILILDDNYSDAALLMGKISALKSHKIPKFVITVDNWGNDNTPTRNNPPFVGYRITTYTNSFHNDEYQDFYRDFLNYNHDAPQNVISYITYSSIQSVIQALDKYPASKKYPMRKRIISSYRKAVKINNHWFKPDKVYVYLMTPGKEKKLDITYSLDNHDQNNNPES